MQYKLLYVTDECLAECLDKLEKIVNEECKLGWKPQGSVSVTEMGKTFTTSYFTAIQAMVKEELFDVR